MSGPSRRRPRGVAAAAALGAMAVAVVSAASPDDAPHVGSRYRYQRQGGAGTGDGSQLRSKRRWRRRRQASRQKRQRSANVFRLNGENSISTAAASGYATTTPVAGYSHSPHRPIPPSLVGSPRIVGGWDAEPGRHPYAVSLQDVDTSQHLCGATLIAPDTLLTAAHCYDKVNLAVIGRYNLYDVNDPGEFEVREIDRRKITLPPYTGPGGNNGEVFTVPETDVYGEAKHPAFNLSDFNFDISHDYMIVKLKGELLDPAKYPPIKLNRNPQVPENLDDPLTVVGWGFTDEDGSLPDVLQEVVLQYKPNDICDQSIGFVGDTTVSYEGFMEPNMLCAHKLHADACLGDSGGPIFLAGGSATDDLQVGIVSFGVGCAHPTLPGIYARISDQARWIDATVCAMSNAPPVDFGCAVADGEGAESTPEPTSMPSGEPTLASAAGAREFDDEETGGNDDGTAGGNQRRKRPGRKKRKKNKNKDDENLASVPTSSPTTAPTSMPTSSPTAEPTSSPTTSPSAAPTFAPTSQPSASPTTSPTLSPAPSMFPTGPGGTTANVGIRGDSMGSAVNMTPGCHSGLYWECVSVTTQPTSSEASQMGQVTWTTAVGMVLGACLLLGGG